MRYIDRDTNGKIRGSYSCPQYEGQEAVVDNAQELLDYETPPQDPNVQIRVQIAAIETQFTDTLKMRAILNDPVAVQTVTTMLSNIDALKAQLV